MTNKKAEGKLPNLGTIDTYCIQDKGIHPFLVRDSWQMVKLNYFEKYGFLNMGTLYRHDGTDKGLALMSGTVYVIAMEIVDDLPHFEMEVLKKGVSYNIPKKTWYTFIMEEGSELILLEKPDTQMNDTVTVQLNEAQLNLLRELFNSKKVKL
ncbi:hypothetical protein [Allomuricauda sp. M10]|uniref:hypothetical protein n=1 Tax=Allomuricauda sp. M10 TaxID=2683292 RepID=UPI001D1849EB|nr:hypothetical protein [Muricauda sp. M10]